jgi:kynurenine formamidase
MAVHTGSRGPVTRELLDEYCERFRNWGKWGTDDEIGTLNYITPARIVEAARLVRQGKVMSLALPFDTRGPQTGRFGRVNPIHQMVATGTDHVAGNQRVLGFEQGPYGFGYADDTVTMYLQTGTQWDGLSHIFRDGKMYNDRDARLVSSAGAARNGIQNYKDKIVARGVLLDIARLKGVDYLEPGQAIYAEDLDAAADRAGVAVGEADIVLIRTGEMGRRLRERNWGPYSAGDAPGISFTTAPWIADKRLAGIASDTWGVEVRPNELEGAFQPLHLVIIVNMGLLVGEIFYLEELAQDCAQDGVYEFLFVAPPLPITGGVGSPINPLAIK